MARAHSAMSITVRIRRILRVLVVAAAIVVVLMITAIALLNTRAARNLALERLQKFLITQDVSIEAADFDFGFLPLRISTGRLSIH
jgi:ABC-type phosphate transport system permease subunit